VKAFPDKLPRATAADMKQMRMADVVCMENSVTFPMHTTRGQNTREHHMIRARRVKKEKTTVMQWLAVSRMPNTLPAGSVVTITRIAPGNGLDDDNLSGSCKSIRDAAAAWVGVDDRHRHLVRYAYAQERGAWGVRIEWKAP
jgi:hypothetical protein